MSTPSRARQKTATRTRIPRRVSRGPRLVPRPRADLFARADHYAQQILFATVTDSATSTEVLDALTALRKHSRYYKPADEQRDGVGDLMNACLDAGLMLGLAFGLRLREAR